jgi:hypothetical protein
MLLSLPAELLHEIVKTVSHPCLSQITVSANSISQCAQRELCHLRSTCKILNELADPIVFRCLKLHIKAPLVTEHQIIALATRSSKACDFTREMRIFDMPGCLRSSEQSPPHLHCEDLRVHLPTAISELKNMTRFRLVTTFVAFEWRPLTLIDSWTVSDYAPDWLNDSLMQAVSRLPQLTELHIESRKVHIPYGLFRNLSILSAESYSYEDPTSLLSEIATAVENSPELRSLGVVHPSHTFDPLVLNEIFAKLSTENPLNLECLYICGMNATVDQVALPHLMHLTSFHFKHWEDSISTAKSVWTSFRVNNIKLTEVAIRSTITEEAMLYLSSFSGLKRLVLNGTQPDQDSVIHNTLFLEVLPKHVNSLETLEILGCTDSGSEKVHPRVSFILSS